VNADRPLPLAHLLRIARRATRPQTAGRTLLAAERTRDGVRLELSSWPRVRQALRGLRAAGYLAREDPRDPAATALLVTGRCAAAAPRPRIARPPRAHPSAGRALAREERER